jgi:iron complex transport system substrate-binding protein
VSTIRIVSLLPSATDIVCSLGLRHQLVGRTHECDWPPGIDEEPPMTADTLDTHRMGSREIHEAIGATVHSGSSVYALDTEALEGAKPDLILTQELCEVCAVSYTEVQQAARMLNVGVKVVSLEPRGIEDILEHVSLVAQLTDAEPAAEELLDELRHRLSHLREQTASLTRPEVFCCEWMDPIFAAGHWVPEQVDHAGGTELLGPRGEPSCEIPWERVVDADPEVLVLMPCGMPIERTLDELDALTSRPGWTGLRAVRTGQVWAVDASSYFNRPGPRVVRGAEILHAILHDEGRGLEETEAVRVS